MRNPQSVVELQPAPLEPEGEPAALPDQHVPGQAGRNLREADHVPRAREPQALPTLDVDEPEPRRARREGRPARAGAGGATAGRVATAARRRRAARAEASRARRPRRRAAEAQSRGSYASLSRASARAERDLTVPCRTPRAAAVSSSERSRR